MFVHRLLRRGHPILIVCLFGTTLSNASAAHIPDTAQLGGWVYIDRNNDGVLNFSNQPNPEYVIGGVSISLFSQQNNVETLVATTPTDDYGRYFFDNLTLGTYALRQAQPVEFLDGLDTLGILQSLTAQPVPPSASPGVMSNNAFTNIVLTANIRGDYYVFGERGLLPWYVSKRYLLGSAPELEMAVPEATGAVLALTAIGAVGLLRRRKRR